MMMTKSKFLLWRVEWNHRAGYQAPYQLIWAEKKKEAIDIAKSKSRLADFPLYWSYQITEIPVFRKPRKVREA